MKTDWFKDVNPGLDRLTEILGMGKPSHGYTIAEKAPEVVTAPGVYFPAKKGEVIPLESREKGGEVNPTQHGDKEHRKLAIIESIVSMMKPMHLESRAMGGLVVPPEPMKLEQSKYDILKSAISILKPPAQQKSTSGEKRLSGGDTIPLESRQMGGEVDPNDQPLMLNTLKSLLKPQGRQSYNERTSAYGSPAGKSMFSSSSSGPDLYDRLKAARGSFDMTPSTPNPPTGMANLPTTGSYSMKPDTLKSEDILDLSKDKKDIWDIPTIPRQAGGIVTPPTEEDEMDKLRRLLKLGPPTTTPVQLSSPDTPESLELASRERWNVPGYPEKRLAEMKETLGPGVSSVSPGFASTYYEAHPEERLMDEITAQNKPIVDMYQKLIEEARTRQQGYGRGFGPTPRERRFGAKMPEYGKDIPELAKGLEQAMARPEEMLGAVTRGRKAPTAPAPHLVQTSTGEYVWATPGGVLPAGIMGKGPTPKVPGAPHPRTTEGYTLVSDPVTGLNTAISPTGQREPYEPKKHGEQELPGVITDEDAKLYANMLVGNEMAPSQLRLVVQPFGQAGGLTKNKIFKMVKQLNPTYNLKLAEAEYAADTKALSNLSNIYAIAQTAMGAAENHGRQILELSSKVDRTGSPALNRYFLAGKKQIAGDTDVNNLDIALHAFDREFARYLTSMTQGGVLAQSEAQAVEKLLTSAKNPQQIIGGIQTIQKLMEGKKASFNDQFARIKGSLGGTQGNQPSGAVKVWKQKPDGTWVQE